jgi:broad specificity phosphatase PhoE
MKLIIIRHGETDYTKQKRYCGSAIDAPLSSIGIKQAQRLRRLFRNQIVDVVYASPLVRTTQTAKIIFDNHPVKIYKNQLLRESNLGKWEGLTLNEIKDLFPDDFKKWYQDPLRYGATDGETPVILQRRIKIFLKRLSNIYKSNKRIKTIAIVTHSGPFRIIIGEISGTGLRDFWNYEPKTCDYQIVQFKN